MIPVSHPVKLAGTVYPSKTTAHKVVKIILASHRDGDVLEGHEFAVVMDTLRRHPNAAEKIGIGIEEIFIRRNGGVASGQGFWFRRLDGSIANFSYTMCLQAKMRSHADRVAEACRSCIRPYVLRWRDRCFEAASGRMQCPETGHFIGPKEAQVDHDGKTFATILSDFLASENMSFEDVKLEDRNDLSTEAVLADKEIQERWIRFHNRNCKLRVLSVDGHKRVHGHS